MKAGPRSSPDAFGLPVVRARGRSCDLPRNIGSAGVVGVKAGAAENVAAAVKIRRRRAAAGEPE